MACFGRIGRRFEFQGCPSLPWASDHHRLKDISLSFINPPLFFGAFLLGALRDGVDPGYSAGQ